LQVDPLVEKYPDWSGYNYVKNNPLHYIDLRGMELSTYTDEDGNVQKVVDDNKTDVYKQKKDGSYELMGHSVSVYSFVDQEHPLNADGTLNAVGKIDFNSTWVGDQINSALNKIDPNIAGFVYYAMNAGEKMDKCNLKTKLKRDKFIWNRQLNFMYFYSHLSF